MDFTKSKRINIQNIPYQDMDLEGSVTVQEHDKQSAINYLYTCIYLIFLITGRLLSILQHNIRIDVC